WCEIVCHGAFSFPPQNGPLALLQGIAPSGRVFAGHARPPRPAGVTRPRASPSARPPATTRSGVATARPLRTSATSCPTLKPCASMIASVTPSREDAEQCERSAAVGLGHTFSVALRATRHHAGMAPLHSNTAGSLFGTLLGHSRR